jgi:hypothetical protein
MLLYSGHVTTHSNEAASTALRECDDSEDAECSPQCIYIHCDAFWLMRTKDILILTSDLCLALFCGTVLRTGGRNKERGCNESRIDCGL